MYQLINNENGEQPTNSEGNPLPCVDIHRNLNNYDDLNKIFYPIKSPELTLVVGWPIKQPMQLAVQSTEESGWTPYSLTDMINQVVYAFYQGHEKAETDEQLILADDAPPFEDLFLVRVIGNDSSPYTMMQLEDQRHNDR